MSAVIHPAASAHILPRICCGSPAASTATPRPGFVSRRLKGCQRVRERRRYLWGGGGGGVGSCPLLGASTGTDSRCSRCSRCVLMRLLPAPRASIMKISCFSPLSLESFHPAAAKIENNVTRPQVQTRIQRGRISELLKEYGSENSRLRRRRLPREFGLIKQRWAMHHPASHGVKERLPVTRIRRRSAARCSCRAPHRPPVLPVRLALIGSRAN